MKVLNQIMVLVVLFALSTQVLAEISIYTIDNQFKAAFPEKPALEGELGNGAEKQRSYSYTDEGNLIIYTATYQVGKNYLDKKNIQKGIRGFAKGQANVLGGEVVSFDTRMIEGNYSAIFVITYKVENINVRKYSIVTYKNGQTFEWSVQDFPSLSALRAKTIFNKYVDGFSVNVNLTVPEITRENKWERYKSKKYKEWKAEESVAKATGEKACSIMGVIGADLQKTKQVLFIVSPSGKVLHRGKYHKMESMLAGNGYTRLEFRVKLFKDVYGIAQSSLGNDFGEFVEALKASATAKVQWVDKDGKRNRESISLSGFSSAYEHCINYLK